MSQLSFHQGTIVLEDFQEDVSLECLLWDDRSRQWRAKAMYYPEVASWLNSKRLPFANKAEKIRRLKLKSRLAFTLREYQQEAVAAWIAANCRGSVCLPTGSGKTWVALAAMLHAKCSCLIVLPTIDLMSQWYDVVSDAFGLPVGILGGGYHEVRDLTVTTYDSAYRHIDKYGDRFGLLIFDEVHHLPAATYSHIPEMSLAPYRLGLTATYERSDGLHGKLERLIGPMLYLKTIKELEGKHLADYEVMKIHVELTRAEHQNYYRHRNLYESYVREKGLKFYGQALEKLVQVTSSETAGRRAFLARHEARRIIIGAEAKLRILETLLKRHCRDCVLIFTESNELVYQISQHFLVPALTHHTKTVERKTILDAFRSGRYSVLVTSKVLNEGVDVPGANVAIILGGSASPVEHVQRLGRILRKSKNKHAVLYELVTSGTREIGVSYRRRKSDAYH